MAWIGAVDSDGEYTVVMPVKKCVLEHRTLAFVGLTVQMHVETLPDKELVVG